MSTVKADNFTWRTGEATANSQYTVTADKIVWGISKTWLNFAGGSGSVGASFGISSLTRTATGTYTVTFSTAFTDSSYTAIGSASQASSGGTGMGIFGKAYDSPIHTTTQFKIYTLYTNNTTFDTGLVGAAFFR